MNTVTSVAVCCCCCCCRKRRYLFIVLVSHFKPLKDLIPTLCTLIDQPYFKSEDYLHLLSKIRSYEGVYSFWCIDVLVSITYAQSHCVTNNPFKVHEQVAGKRCSVPLSDHKLKIWPVVKHFEAIVIARFFRERHPSSGENIWGYL